MKWAYKVMRVAVPNSRFQITDDDADGEQNFDLKAANERGYFDRYQDALSALLNQAGEQGWELVSSQADGQAVLLFLKRPQTE